MAECKWPRCDRPVHGNGLCVTHYRKVTRREKAVERPHTQDAMIYKVRVWDGQGKGSRPLYFSNESAAWKRVAKARKEGNLLFFGAYKVTNVFYGTHE